jgi:dipeptidyl aminopeptidase/acylaminoacyl peptidase
MKWIAFVTLAFFSVSASSTTLPLEYFTKHGDYLDLKLSPDGKHIAARIRTDNRIVMAILETETMKIISGIRPPNNDIVHTVNWVNSERLVFEYAEKFSQLDEPTPTGELFAMDVDGGQRELIYGFRAGDAQLGSRLSNKDDTYATQEILSYLEGDDDHILIIEYPWQLVAKTYYDNRNRKPIISKLNIYNGRKRKVEVLPYGHSYALANKTGEINFMGWRDEDNNFHAAYRETMDSPWKSFEQTFNFDDTFMPLGISEDSKHVYLSGRVGDERIATLFQMSLETGDYEKVFDSHDTDVEFSILDKNNMPAVGVTYPGKSEYVYAKHDSRTKDIHKMLVDAFDNQTVNITSRTQDGKTLLVHVSSDVNPGEYYLFDRDTLSAQFIWANSSWIDPRTLSSMKPISFETDDGLTINGYLTLPKFTEKDEKPPLVVMIHGGPHQPGTRDFWDYNSETQLLASRGYAVLQVNFRGSDGYGSKFIRKGYREWGGKMIDDINAATRWAIDNGHADSDKVCAYGASYGGYAALMAVVREPDMYKCTIGYVGIYDLTYAFTESDIPTNWGGKSYLKRVLGNDEAQLQEYSPINHISEIKANVMLIHGAKDKRVPEINAEALADKLSAAGKPPVYLQYKQAGHGVYDEEDRAELYQGLLDFLAENI